MGVVTPEWSCVKDSRHWQSEVRAHQSAETSGKWTGQQQSLPQCAFPCSSCLICLHNHLPVYQPFQSLRALQITLPRTKRALSGSLPSSNIFNAPIRKVLTKRKPRGQIIKLRLGSPDTLILVLELLDLGVQMC